MRRVRLHRQHHTGTRAIYLQVGNGSFTEPATGAALRRQRHHQQGHRERARGPVGNGTRSSDERQHAGRASGTITFLQSADPCLYRRLLSLARHDGHGDAFRVDPGREPVDAAGDTIPLSQISWASERKRRHGHRSDPRRHVHGGTQTLATGREHVKRLPHVLPRTHRVSPRHLTGRATYAERP